MSYDPLVTIRKALVDALTSGLLVAGIAFLTWLQGTDLNTLHIPMYAIPFISAGTTALLNFLKNVKNQ